MKRIRIAYIGGGSRLWARGLMSDLAVEPELSGEVSLYDIDQEAARNNAVIGNRMMALPEAVGKWTFTVADTLEECLGGADFVFISILPATFEEMEAYVHVPERWGVYQPVGDTAGPSGIFRSLIMMPIYKGFAEAIRRICPHAWVVNFSNPMTMCVQTLYHVFPEVKAFGNCHEVSFVQRILARALKEVRGIDAERHEIAINPKGINHFTWIDYASYRDIDLMPIYAEYVERHHREGVREENWRENGPFESAERVKFDLFRRFGIIAAAGDRHLVEFLPQSWYLKDPAMVEEWRYFLTPVSLRKRIKQWGDDSALRIIAGTEQVKISGSGEEGVAQLKAILGLSELVTNVNMPNLGQIPSLPLGHIVETNALFRKDDIRPVYAGPLPGVPGEITLRHVEGHRLLLKAFDEKNLEYALAALSADVAVDHLPQADLRAMFLAVSERLGPYLDYYEATPADLRPSRKEDCK